MSKKKKLLMPPSSAGIVRYSESDKMGIKIKPEYVVAMVVITIILEIFLHTM